MSDPILQEAEPLRRSRAEESLRSYQHVLASVTENTNPRRIAPFGPFERSYASPHRLVQLPAGPEHHQ